MLKCVGSSLAGLLLCATMPAHADEQLIYHPISTDTQGRIVSWAGEKRGEAYDRVMSLAWKFWRTMPVEANGLPYYMNHQVFRAEFPDPRGLGGDQLAMAMSSWRLYYAYTGDERLKQNMRFIADWVLTHGMSKADAKWANIPYPYNTAIYSGIYDGDMMFGQGVTMPPLAGSFGLELINLYKMCADNPYHAVSANRYRDAALAIADTLAAHTVEGDANHSPLPFKVVAQTGEIPKRVASVDGAPNIAVYTTSWAPTLELLEAALAMDADASRKASWATARRKLLDWMRRYPLVNNRWGPFFEDVSVYSDTQINATGFARYMMEHRDEFPHWRRQVPGIFDWVYKTLGARDWEKYGVVVVREQTIYPVPAQSHTSRQAAAELLYAQLSDDQTRTENAMRQLDWATYMVDFDGKNRFPQDEVWLTDGYGDYIRHYLRAMAARPAIAPVADRLLASTSVVQQADYAGALNKYLVPYVPAMDRGTVRIYYKTFDSAGTETLRLSHRPRLIVGQGEILAESDDATKSGYRWQSLPEGGGVMLVRRIGVSQVTILD